MNDKFFIDINCQQRNHEGEKICGDVYLNKKIAEENRIIAVLSDGMGHGVKANVLATLTATMAMNFSSEYKEPKKIAEIIMKVLPVCSIRKMSYSTFTIVDIEIDGKVTILEYENPTCQIFRGSKVFMPDWQCILLEDERSAGKELRTCSFYPQLEDRIFFWSDGITQSGLGSSKFPFGWGLEDLTDFVKKQLKKNPQVSANQISSQIVNRAYQNDGFVAKDDTSCVSAYFRKARKLLLCTGPPYEEDKDAKLGELVETFDGNKIVCGATTADIISRELNLKIKDSFDFTDPDLPPISYMEEIDLLTEGILTLSKVNQLLEDYSPSFRPGLGPADQIIKFFMESDEIYFNIGTRINIAHQDPNLPIDLEIRRTVVKRIARQLENKLMKVVKIQYI
ncbi:MAG: SpoIIE family protein phosphatase [Hyphomicrobiales bacterium]